MTALEAPRLRGGVAASVLLHGALIAAFIFLHGRLPPPGPPMVQAHLVAAPMGPRQLGVVQEAPAASVPPATQPPPPTKTPPVVKTKTPVPKPKAKPVAKTPPQSSLPTPPAAHPTPKEPQPTAGSGEAGGKGSDITNLDTGGIEFPYPDYLRRVENLVLSRFNWQNSQPLVAEVSFIINRDGSVDPTSIKLVTPSKVYSFNQQALGAVEAGSNNKAFGPLPAGYREDILPVTFRFIPKLGR